jgi:hypothetical protein
LWIEQLMIAYNEAAARVVAGRGILRAHSGVVSDLKELAVRTGVPEIEFLGSASGRYTADVKDARHNGLGLDLYCHTSSPFRRYADLVNQRWIKSILFDGIAVVNPNLLSLNERCGVIKRMERFLWFLTNISTDSITTVGGHIVAVKGDKVRVYVPRLRRILKGVITEGVILGDPVKCRIWCNRRACTLDNRYVIQVSK